MTFYLTSLYSRCDILHTSLVNVSFYMPILVNVTFYMISLVNVTFYMIVISKWLYTWGHVLYDNFGYDSINPWPMVWFHENLTTHLAQSYSFDHYVVFRIWFLNFTMLYWCLYGHLNPYWSSNGLTSSIYLAFVIT